MQERWGSQVCISQSLTRCCGRGVPGSSASPLEVPGRETADYGDEHSPQWGPARGNCRSYRHISLPTWGSHREGRVHTGWWVVRITAEFHGKVLDSFQRFQPWNECGVGGHRGVLSGQDKHCSGYKLRARLFKPLPSYLWALWLRTSYLTSLHFCYLICE